MCEPGQFRDDAPADRSWCRNSCAVMNEKTWRLAVPAAAFDNLLCRPLGGRMRRHMHVDNLSAGVMDVEEDVECPKEDRLDAEEITRPDGRCVLLHE